MASDITRSRVGLVYALRLIVDSWSGLVVGSVKASEVIRD